MSELTEVIQPTRISVDTLPYSFISNLHHRFADKVYGPTLDDVATDRLIALRQQWRKMGHITLFTSGVFDLLHMDHMAYLLHVKASGAAIHYEHYNNGSSPWDELDQKRQQEYTLQALSRQAVKLVVSVDGDKSVAYRKADKPEKRGIPTPIYAWQTRALMVAGLTYVDPLDETGHTFLPTVDAVTIHGPQDFDTESSHVNHFDLVGALQPDAWVFFGESADIAEAAPYDPNLSSVKLRCITDGVGTHYFTDANIGKMSTTKIATRIRGN